VASSSGERPFYATIWFTVLATAAVIGILLLVAATVPDVGGRPNRGIGQFGVVLIAIYWVIIFPKLRRVGRDRAPVSTEGTKTRENP